MARHLRPPETLAAWRRLATLAAEPRAAEDEGRFASFSRRLGPLLVDCSKERIDQDVQSVLLDLAAQSELADAIADLFAGAIVNDTENRPALHMELRKPAATAKRGVRETRERFLDLAEKIRAGAYRGSSGKAIDTVLHVGIGGSHLGPALAIDALALASASRRVRFLANIDGAATANALADLDPATTLVVVASKGLTTLETKVNAEAVKQWFAAAGARDLTRHFVAVTANREAARTFGVADEQCLPMSDSVGGRYSLWSAVGLTVAVAIGRAAFEDMLAGAHEVDAHFASASMRENLPVLLALLQVWNTNFLGASSHAILPYDHRLRLLPAYLQQLEMESNGKSTRRGGEPAGTHTAPIVWGGEETGGQHAFHQLLHQGTRAFSADFIVCARPDHNLPGRHDWLLANCLAQSKAMREGRSAGPAHKRVPGGHATTTILLDELTPRALGALLALYEHKVFSSAMIWGINPFDQWGVELGKTLADSIHKQLRTDDDWSGQDDSTRGLLAELRRLR